MEGFYMSMRTKCIKLLLSLLFGILANSSQASLATDSVKLYTVNTRVSVAPGESIDYIVDIVNNSSEIKNVDLSLEGVPRGWNCTLKSGVWNIGQISIRPGEKKSVDLRIEVPLKVNKGSYRIKVVAGGFDSMPLVVTITEQGTFKTEFTSEQYNLSGNTKSSFLFNSTLRNRTGEKQMYALMANAPRGWNVTFKLNFQPISSINIDANGFQAILIDIKPPEQIEAGTYKIPVNAATGVTSASMELEVVITGSYSMELTTPTGLLSATITAGDEKRLELLINNTGSSELTGISLSFSVPANWEVIFDPKQVDKVQPGKAAQVFATIKADKKAIPGDYVTNFEAKTRETSSKISFRISVETPMLWGWIGILIIVVALGSVYYLFRKYGRR
jgi:uncharacterized membrane protein